MPTVSGAYGRDYKSKKEILADWNEGKDFQMRDVFSGGGSYLNKQDAEAAGMTSVSVRYKKDIQIAVLNRKGDDWK